jgi:hypothetical protein
MVGGVPDLPIQMEHEKRSAKAVRSNPEARRKMHEAIAIAFGTASSSREESSDEPT